MTRTVGTVCEPALRMKLNIIDFFASEALMKIRNVLAMTLLVASPSLLANTFQPTQGACNGVSKEISRVSKELKETKSSIQGEWLKKQLKALESKKSSCTTKGFSVN